MDNKPKVEEVASALVEHFKEIFLPTEAAKKIVDRVHKGGSERAVVGDVELMLMEFLLLAANKNETMKDVFDKLKK